MTIKSSELLRNELTDWEEDVQDAIFHEMRRIGKFVPIADLSDNPFSMDIFINIDGLFLEKEEVVLKTSFADRDNEKKSLSQCMSDSDIDSWGLLGLLDGLKGIDVKL